MLDQFCQQIRSRLSSSIIRKLEGSTVSSLTISNKLRNLVKSLLQLGANLSQSREFRDLLEDLMTKVKYHSVNHYFLFSLLFLSSLK